MKLAKIFTQKGETIVEVLIAVAVIAVTLGGAFAISNRSEKTTQANQERYQAQLYANEQADNLKQFVNSQTDGLKNLNKQNAQFCVNNNDIYAATDSNCKKINTITYSISVSKASGIDNNFKILVNWNGLLNPNERVELLYGL